MITSNNGMTKPNLVRRLSELTGCGCRGEFRAYDKGELDGMRQAADKQAAKVEQQVKQTDPEVRVADTFQRECPLEAQHGPACLKIAHNPATLTVSSVLRHRCCTMCVLGPALKACRGVFRFSPPFLCPISRGEAARRTYSMAR